MNDVVTAPEIDQVIARLTAGEAAWAATGLPERIRLLGKVHEAVAEHADAWVEVAVSIKQLPAASPLVGEEWLSGPWAMLKYVPALIETLSRLHAGSDVLAGYDFDPAPDDRLAIQVFPHGMFDRLLLNGYRAEVWMPAGVTEEQIRAGAGMSQRRPAETRGVALVLGAGNIFSIPPLDVLYQLFAENRAVVLKLNPITDPLLDVYRQVFAPFIDLGAVEIVTGGAETGSALAQHPGIAAVHMTGSEATHDAIVWGIGRGRARSQGGRHAAAGQADHQRARRRRARHHRARTVVSGGPAVPGTARGHPAAAQQRLQLHRGAGRRHQLGLGPEETPS